MTSNGITADTGFLIALERHKQRATDLAGFASARKLLISAPVVVIAEWWRGGPGQSRILKFVRAEEMTVKPIFQAIDTGAVQATTSVLTLLEVLVKPLETKATALAEDFRAAVSASANLRVIDVDRPIAEPHRRASLRYRGVRRMNRANAPNVQMPRTR